MDDSWREFPRAPKPGTAICLASELKPGLPRFLEIDGFPILLLKDDGGLRAFINACPHQFLPLNYRGDTVLSADGARLRCSNHSAEFDAATGAGCKGFGLGCALTPVPVKAQGGRILVG